MWLSELVKRTKSAWRSIRNSPTDEMSDERRKLYDLSPGKFTKSSILKDTSDKFEVVLPNIHQYCRAMSMAIELYALDGQIVLTGFRFEKKRVTVEEFFLTADGFYSDRVEAVREFRDLALRCHDAHAQIADEQIGVNGAKARTLAKLLVNVRGISDQLRDYVET